MSMTVAVELVSTRCWCGIEFAIPRAMYDGAQRLGDKYVGIHCPLGHTMVYGGKTDAEKRAERLASELERERRRNAATTAELDQTKASLRAQKGANTRLKKRVAAGVCPCCKRTFKQLARHMQSQHPGYPTES